MNQPTANGIRARYQAIKHTRLNAKLAYDREMEQLREEIVALQNLCQHPNKEYFSSPMCRAESGWSCPDCGKEW